MWPPVVAVDAGPMQIQWCEGAVLSRAETVLQGTTHDTVHAEIGYGKKAPFAVHQLEISRLTFGPFCRSMSRRGEDRHLLKAIWAFLPRRSPASG